ncbi:lipoprotein insertase outer membrane protein LolB [Pseudoalteromonas sp. SSDWG2]|uniref:lipoprotein insertase outer membrane protein LolB n=1 Tax=Pseudoalteromonas sp. SSDWG2 TaxID=3139391 RepID=UPI003BA9A5A2
MINFRLILLVFFLFITGCAQQIQKTTPPDNNWRERLQRVEQFSAQGKMAFISAKKRQSANFVWQQQNDDYGLDLNTFIGTNVLRLNKHATTVDIEVDGEYYQGDDPQRLVYQLTGWLLPLSQPERWLLATMTENAQLDELGRVISSSWTSPDNRQWQIQYRDYQAQFGVWLPKSITLVQDNLKIKLLINQWQVQ